MGQLPEAALPLSPRRQVAPMLTIENLPVALTALGFHAKGQRYSKSVGTATLQRYL